jgi:hypothetical protein
MAVSLYDSWFAGLDENEALMVASFIGVVPKTTPKCDSKNSII